MRPRAGLWITSLGSGHEPSAWWNASRRPSSCRGGGSGGRAPVVSVRDWPPRISLPISPVSSAKTDPIRGIESTQSSLSTGLPRAQALGACASCPAAAFVFAGRMWLWAPRVARLVDHDSVLVCPGLISTEMRSRRIIQIACNRRSAGSCCIAIAASVPFLRARWRDHRADAVGSRLVQLVRGAGRGIGQGADRPPDGQHRRLRVPARREREYQPGEHPVLRARRFVRNPSKTSWPRRASVQVLRGPACGITPVKGEAGDFRPVQCGSYRQRDDDR